MSTPPAANDESPPGLTASLYDQVAGGIVSLLVFVGAIVAVLFILWLTYSSLSFSPPPAEVQVLDELSGSQSALGAARELEEPGLEELADVVPPQLPASLDMVDQIVEEQTAELAAMPSDATALGGGQGLGDSRQAGPGGDGDSGILSRAERWLVEYDETDLSRYPEQLDHFGVELAAIGGGQESIDFVYNVSKPTPDRLRAPADAAKIEDRRENWLYYVWRPTADPGRAKLRAADARLLASAGVPSAGRVLLQFFPPAVENRLATIENAALRGRDLRDVRKTVFGVRPAGNSYSLYVKRIDFKSE